MNWKALAKYEFALPSLEEQRRIAEVLQAALMSTCTLLRLVPLCSKVERTWTHELPSMLPKYTTWTRRPIDSMCCVG